MKKINSVSVRLAVRFTVLVTVLVLVLSIAFSVVLGIQVRAEKDAELQKSVEFIIRGLKQKNPKPQKNPGRNHKMFFPQLPYYITYTVWKEEPKNNAVISTNDPFLPFLPETGNKSRSYFSKDYFLDGDLNILYFAKKVQVENDSYMVQSAINMDNDSTTHLMKQIPKVAALAFFPILVISFLISLFMTKRTLKPVVKMTASAKEISSENLESQLPVSKRMDELDQLAQTFNQLFSQLNEDFKREKQFTSDVSHELKTPVAVILGQSNLLRRWGKDDPVQLEKSLETIINEAKSMQAIIENLLQMSRLESGRVQPEICPVNLNSIFNRLKEECISVNPQAQVSIIQDNDQESVLANQELLHQVMTVVVSNSLKYVGSIKDEQGNFKVPEITINTESSICNESETKIIYIEDNGNGFDEASIDQVFDRFFRQDSAHSRTAGGSGLGLSIAKVIIHALNGEISAYNAESGGAGIKIQLPSA